MDREEESKSDHLKTEMIKVKFLSKEWTERINMNETISGARIDDIFDKYKINPKIMEVLV